MTLADLAQIVGVAALAAGLVGALGLGVAWATRAWSLRWQLLVLAAAAGLGGYAGTLAIAWQMFISSHDLLVVTVVSTVSLLMAVALAVAMSWPLARWSATLQGQVRSLGPGLVPGAVTTGPREWRALSDELAEAQRRLEQARLRELRLEESRRELVSWVSHDLRTPLAGMRAMAEALEDGLAPDPSRFHRQIRVEVDRMAAMVDDLFELSRIHAGVLRLTPTTLALGDLVSEAIAGADPLARARNVRLGGDVDADLEVTADPAGLSRVLSNLLVNAIRHTPSDGVVEVIGRRHDDGVEVLVSDGCGGLRQDEIERVFDLGWQGEQARTPSAAGTPGGPTGAGLGLAIVKGIVEAHHGRVGVENLPADGGCRFSVLLPRAVPA
ncbi:HAMP domain-containing histidine kinase [Nocardioides sp. TRM66260-LWL]|uniref:sensor histidine kinase n=1 Tax=Nocardioides sp. TRM66260-LWL TaxID=2874478 RepID=UPI001CC4B3B7|nr:HAMP domain-containing sensor histidine kinase [Nocardioides sp. TRM66260-LWL]MBZ5735517.1 HAMP domain-containing histidine kinase [Nocardioides sp. TRM66260-LWL]